MSSFYHHKTAKKESFVLSPGHLNNFAFEIKEKIYKKVQNTNINSSKEFTKNFCMKHYKYCKVCAK